MPGAYSGAPRQRRNAQGKYMKIDIERFGLKEVSVDPETVFTFAEGLAGFAQCKRFKFFHEEGKPTVFWLQSLEQSDIMFPIVAPDMLDIEYQIDLSDADCALLDLEKAEDAAIVVILYRNETSGIAANTRSPLILNLKSRKGMQKILQDVQPKVLYRAR
ncbi:MAG: flagellar biosynthesis protein FliW [Candidatus Accumulibacter sp.]|nr:flagellar biosynthesis protein FliW [Accumulibacter sp.]MBA4093591.1 flagellar biosynthesis protein FliW [Accumulibacter sp.]